MPTKLDAAGLERAQRILRRRDPVLRDLIRKVGPCALRPRGDPYGSLVRSILHQQLAGAAARSIEARLRGHFGGRTPRPGALLAASTAELRGVGLSRQKIAALRSVAQAFEDGELSSRRLHRLDDDEVVGAVTRVHGVGEWTAHMLLMFSLGRPDVLPVGDYGIRKGVQGLYGLRKLPDARRIEGIAAPWRPWRSVASWYLWRAGDV